MGDFRNRLLPVESARKIKLGVDLPLLIRLSILAVSISHKCRLREFLVASPFVAFEEEETHRHFVRTVSGVVTSFGDQRRQCSSLLPCFGAFRRTSTGHTPGLCFYFETTI